MAEHNTARRRAAILLVAGAVLANVAFVGLASVFEYPDVLQQPAADVLAKFQADQATIVLLFSLLALGAGLLAPAAVFVARLVEGSLGRWIVRLGIAAAVAQVIGLLRWPLLVPSLAERATDDGASAAARADAGDTFVLISDVLGTGIGETLGYLLTAAWTVLLVQAFRHGAGPWFAALGLTASALILVGVVVPLGVPGADLANFVGYILWSLWLIAFATHLWRHQGESQADKRRGAAAFA
jgi:Domain of unknown function (DUF4386)